MIDWNYTLHAYPYCDVPSSRCGFPFVRFMCSQSQCLFAYYCCGWVDCTAWNMIPLASYLLSNSQPGERLNNVSTLSQSLCPAQWQFLVMRSQTCSWFIVPLQKVAFVTLVLVKYRRLSTVSPIRVVLLDPRPALLNLCLGCFQPAPQKQLHSYLFSSKIISCNLHPHPRFISEPSSLSP